MEAPIEDERNAAPIPKPNSHEHSSKDESEEGHKEHGKVFGSMNHVTQWVPMSSCSHLRRRGVLVDVGRGGLRRRAKVHRAEDTVTQQERAHEKECEKPAMRREKRSAWTARASDHAAARWVRGRGGGCGTDALLRGPYHGR